MKKNAWFLAAAMLLMPVLSSAATTSPGKSSAFISTTGTLDASGDIPVVSAQILLAKKKTVLKVDVTLTVAGSAAVPAVYLTTSVNAAAMTSANHMVSQCDTGNGENCTITATFWLDVDAAEASYPGLFVGHPLAISVLGGNQALGGLGLAYTANVSAIIVKK